MKKIINIGFIFCLALLFTGCVGTGEEIVGSYTHEFPNGKWLRFSENGDDVEAYYIVHDVEIKDTAAAYTITLDFTYTPRLSEMNIPIVFSVISPDGEESHVRPTLLITDVNRGLISKVIYPVKYFKTPGIYKIQFFQKTTKVVIDGAVSTKVKVVKSGK